MPVAFVSEWSLSSQKTSQLTMIIELLKSEGFFVISVTQGSLGDTVIQTSSDQPPNTWNVLEKVGSLLKREELKEQEEREKQNEIL